jgi:membrane protein implicated in regulation of membrane protease activity
LVIVPLNKAQNTSAFDKQATIGTWAKVISPIPQGGYGKIRYSVSGSVVTSPAKSEDGGEINSGENVAIVYIEGNTYFVKREIPQNVN